MDMLLNQAVIQSITRASQRLSAIASAACNRQIEFGDATREGLRQLLDADGKYRPSASESAIPAVTGKPKRLDFGYSAVFRGTSADGVSSAYKPSYLESLSDRIRRPQGYYEWKPLRYGIPGGGGALAQREVCAYRVDEALGFGRVPPTAIVDGPYGPGSSQLWVHSGASHMQIARLQRQNELGRMLSIDEIAELRHLNIKYPKVQRE